MDPKVKARWIDALQSGNYKIAYAEESGEDGQLSSTPCLRKQDVFSVLGVLCDLHLEERLGWWREYRAGRCRLWRYFCRGTKDAGLKTPPDPVRVWAGIPTCEVITVDHPMCELEKATSLCQALKVLSVM